MLLCSALAHLDYTCCAWYVGLTKSLKKKLQVCQNKMIRYISDLSPLHSINCNVLNSLDLLNVEDRVRQLRLNHVYNISHGSVPSYLSEKFILRSAVSSRNTRASSNVDYFIPHVKACQADTLYYNGIKDWNFLPLLNVSREIVLLRNKFQVLS
jgi:hypothetical protein